MKKTLVIILLLIFMFSFTGNAAAIYFLIGEPPITQTDKNVATKFFNDLKFDLSQASNGTIKITLPKTPSKTYFFWISQSCIDKDTALITNSNNDVYQGIDVGDIYQGNGGKIITQKISKNYTNEFVISFCNDDIGRVICVEYYRHDPVSNTIQHMDSATLKIPLKDQSGTIIAWLNVTGQYINPPASKFSDLYSGYWALDVINKLDSLGYINGYPDGTFKPDSNITRAEFMVMLGNVLRDKYPSGNNISHQGEKSIILSSHWAFNPVTQTFGYMATSDMQNIFKGKFHPDQAVTREEVVAVLNSTLTNHTNFQKPSETITNLTDRNVSEFPEGIDFSVKNNLVTGYPDGTFKPKNNITRAEVTALMIRVLDKM